MTGGRRSRKTGQEPNVAQLGGSLGSAEKIFLGDRQTEDVRLGTDADRSVGESTRNGARSVHFQLYYYL